MQDTVYLLTSKLLTDKILLEDVNQKKPCPSAMLEIGQGRFDHVKFFSPF